MENVIFGVDVGGTNCKLGLFDESGNLLEKWEIPTDRTRVCEDVYAELCGKLAQRGLPREAVRGIGMGLPGTKDRQGRFTCPNLDWDCYPAGNIMRQVSGGMTVYTGNDANLAALGEMWRGSGVGHRNVVMATIGTGVGGGILIDGKIVEGAHGAGGEIGCIVVDPHETRPCPGGPQGRLEQYASATGLRTMMREALQLPHEPSMLDEEPRPTVRGLFSACEQGDTLALRILHTFADLLGKGLARVAYVVDPEIFILGGGVSKAGPILLDAVQAAFRQDMPALCHDTRFALAALGNDAGIYGAAKLILDLTTR